jgi:hypothetical protein
MRWPPGGLPLYMFTSSKKAKSEVVIAFSRGCRQNAPIMSSYRLPIERRCKRGQGMPVFAGTVDLSRLGVPTPCPLADSPRPDVLTVAGKGSAAPSTGRGTRLRLRRPTQAAAARQADVVNLQAVHVDLVVVVRDRGEQRQATWTAWSISGCRQLRRWTSSLPVPP